jgi:hypothetical protein
MMHLDLISSSFNIVYFPFETDLVSLEEITGQVIFFLP